MKSKDKQQQVHPLPDHIGPEVDELCHILAQAVARILKTGKSGGRQRPKRAT